MKLLKNVYFIVGVLSALVFCSIYGIHILNPTYTDWLLESGGDLAQHYLGWKEGELMLSFNQSQTHG